MIKALVGLKFCVIEDSVNQFHCASLSLLLINRSHNPGRVSPSQPATHKHASLQHISQCTVSLPLIWGHSEIWVFMFCPEYGVSRGGDLVTYLWCFVSEVELSERPSLTLMWHVGSIHTDYTPQ